MNETETLGDRSRPFVGRFDHGVQKLEAASASVVDQSSPHFSRVALAPLLPREVPTDFDVVRPGDVGTFERLHERGTDHDPVARSLDRPGAIFPIPVALAIEAHLNVRSCRLDISHCLTPDRSHHLRVAIDSVRPPKVGGFERPVADHESFRCEQFHGNGIRPRPRRVNSDERTVGKNRLPMRTEFGSPPAMNDKRAAGHPEPLDSATVEALDRTLFVLWGFPELTQTFIHRELEQMIELGARVHVLAAQQRAREGLSTALAGIVADARFLGNPAVIAQRAAAFAARNPVRMAKTLAWAARLPHRTAFRRARMTWLVFAAASVADEVMQGGFQYLHAHFASYHTEWTMCLSRLTGLPYGFTAHATGIWSDRNLLPEKVGSARVVMTCTRHNRDHLVKIAPEHRDRIHLVHHGIPLSNVTLAPIPPGPPKWLAVGRLIQKKGFDVLLNAVARLRKKEPQVQLRIVGGGPEETNLKRQVEELGLGETVIFTGPVENAAVWRALGEAHGLVAPSIEDPTGDIDGIPNVVLEAMAMARPVVGSRISGLPEAIEDGVTGRLVPPKDSQALADALFEVGADLEAAARMGERGRAKALAYFEVQTNTAQQLRLIRIAQTGAAQQSAS